MSEPDTLVNKGFILNQESEEPGRTFIVTGLYRSGTSLVASILQAAGIFMGSEINDIVFEDEAIARALESGDTAALSRCIAERNAAEPRWGFKDPMLWRWLRPEQFALFQRPRLIATFRDPVSVAVRASLSEYHEPMSALVEAAFNQGEAIAFIAALKCPTLLLSYEKALSFPNDFIAAIMRFCNLPDEAGMRNRLLALIEVNRPTYLASARRRFEGLIEGVIGNRLYGWCCLTRSAQPVMLDVLVDDRHALTVVADSFRQDLLDAGLGNGSHGYFVPLKDLHAGPGSVIRVRVARHGVELNNSGRRLSEFPTRS